MENLDKETIVKILAGFAVIVSAFIAGMLGFFAQWKLKQIDKAQEEKKEKEAQKLKFYIPLLRCLYELDDRFNRIFDNLDKDWLDIKHLESIKNKEGFAKNPKETGYFIISSIYMIAYFFGVTEAIKKGVDTTKLTLKKNRKGRFFNWLSNLFSTETKYDIFQFDPDITIVCRLLQNKELFRTYMSSRNFKKESLLDASEIHKHIQHSIGEMMLVSEGDDKYRVKSFKEFYELYLNDLSFRFWFLLIEGYFVNLKGFDTTKTFEKNAEDRNDIRPLRLLAIQFWCRKLMKNISNELELEQQNFKTREPDDILKNVSEELRTLISTYTLKNSETYLLGLKLNNE